MEELFPNIPEHIRLQTQAWIELAFTQPNVPAGIKMIESYRDSCNEEEKEYVDFAIAAFFEQHRSKNESNSD